MSQMGPLADIVVRAPDVCFREQSGLEDRPCRCQACRSGRLEGPRQWAVRALTRWNQNDRPSENEAATSGLAGVCVKIAFRSLGLHGRTSGQTSKTRRLFCPTSQARRAKIYHFPKDRSYGLKKSSRARYRGASPSSRSVARVVMDALGAAGECTEGVRSSCVVLIPRRWDQSPGQKPGGMVAKTPGHQGERGVSRKAIAQGMPVVSALPV
jgi:hypothetical protein